MWSDARDAAVTREPAMNPWHLAQALIANSPLEREVLVMMENSALTPYYKQLVANEQDGVNMLSIMESELDYWRDEQTKALMAYTAAAMEEEPAVPFADAINLHAQYPVEGSDQVVLGLRLANNDLQGARSQVNAKLQGPHDSWWDVQDLWIATLESGTSPDEVTNADRNELEAIAGNGGGGAAAASAWLSALGTALQPGIQLPNRTRSYHATDDHNGQALSDVVVRVLPNPTAGEAVVAYTLPEGMEGATITLFDATGREVWRKAMTRSSGLEDLPASLLLPGIYQVVLAADGFTLGSTKLVVIR